MDLILRLTRQAGQRSAAARPEQAHRRAATVVLRTVATAITLPALCQAWPPPVRAQTPVPDTPQTVAVTNASINLNQAIEAFAAGTGSATAVTAAQNAYNAAVNAAISHGGTEVTGPTTVSGLNVQFGFASVISVNPGPLTFSNRVTNNGGFHIGPVTVGVGPAPPVAPPSFVVFSGISSSASGGAMANTGTATITGSSFSGNTTGLGFGGNGGAIANTAGTATITITDSSFSGNTTGQNGLGGAIYNAGTAAIIGSFFSANKTSPTTSTTDGGAIFNDTAAMLTVTGSTFENNEAHTGANGTGAGGAILNSAGIATISNSLFGGTPRGSAARSGMSPRLGDRGY